MIRRNLVSWLVLALIVGGIVYWFSKGDERLDLLRAGQRGQVDLTLAGDGPSKAGLTVARTGGSGGALYFRLPAGTVIRDPSGASQSLMTAVPATIQLAKHQSTASLALETYCLEPMKPPPGLGSALAFEEEASDGGAGPDESAARELVTCLKPEAAAHGERQFAVWIVAQGYLEKPYADVQAMLKSSLRSELKAEMTSKVADGFERELRRTASWASEAQIQRQLARFTPQRIETRLEQEADAMTEQYLRGLLGARPLLANCGYAVDKLAFFATGPAAAD